MLLRFKVFKATYQGKINWLLKTKKSCRAISHQDVTNRQTNDETPTFIIHLYIHTNLGENIFIKRSKAVDNCTFTKCRCKITITNCVNFKQDHSLFISS